MLSFRIGQGAYDFSCAYHGGLYDIFKSLQPVAMQSNYDAKPNIVDAAMTLILPRVYPQYGIIQFSIVYQ